jgi:hypothetical protein
LPRRSDGSDDAGDGIRTGATGTDVDDLKLMLVGAPAKRG